MPAKPRAEGVRKIKLPWAPINTQGKGGNGADAEGIWFDCLQEQKGDSPSRTNVTGKQLMLAHGFPTAVYVSM